MSEKLCEIVSKAPIVDVSEFKRDRKSILDKDNNIQVFFPTIAYGRDPKPRKRLNQKFYIFSKLLFGDKIPLWNDLEKWHKILWSDDKVIKVLKIDDIAKEIHEKYTSIEDLSKKLNISTQHTIRWLNYLYAFIDEVGELELYKNYKLIPNQKGIFKTGLELKLENDNSRIEPEFVCVLRMLNPDRDLFEILVHRKIECQYIFQKIGLKEDISSEINQLLQLKDDNGYPIIFKNKNKAVKILQLLLSFKTDSTKQVSDKQKVYGYSLDIFGHRKERIVPFCQDFNTDNVVKHMIRLINEEISNSKDINGLSELICKTEEDTLRWLNEFLNFQVKSTEFENLIYWANVIPNKYNQFKAHGKQEDKDRMYCPYSLVNGVIDNELDPIIIQVLFDLSKEVKDDWKRILVHEKIILKTLPSKKWNDLGPEVDAQVSKIQSSIIDHSEEQKQVYLEPMLTLLDWCEQKSNISIAKDHFKTTYANKDKLYLQLTYSSDNVAILKDRKTLDIAKKIMKSALSPEAIDKTIDQLQIMSKRLGVNAVDEFLLKAEKFIEYKEEFNNRFDLGKTIEDLLISSLKSEGIGIQPDRSTTGSFDIEVYKIDNPSKILKLEVKSYKSGSNYDFRFATRQIIEASNNSSNYIVCSLERPIDENADIDYLKANLKVQSNLQSKTMDIIDIVRLFDQIYNETKLNNHPLEIPCIAEPRVKIPKKELLEGTGNYDDLIKLIVYKLN